MRNAILLNCYSRCVQIKKTSYSYFFQLILADVQRTNKLFESKNVDKVKLQDDLKIAKYAELGQRFIFQSVAVETSGAMEKSTINFFRFGSPTVGAISGSMRDRFPVPESVFGYSQRELLKHFAVVP